MMVEDLKMLEGSSEDFAEVVDLMYKHEGWFVSYRDLDVYRKACSTNGYRFIVTKDSNGKLLGCVSIAILDTDLAFIDNFYTDPDYRSRGIGRRNFAAAFSEEIKRRCNVGLHSDLKVTEYYKNKQGFTHVQKFDIEVFHITNFIRTNFDAQKFRVADAKVAMNDVLTVDRWVWKKSRKFFLEVWITREDASARVIYCEDQPVGYGVIRSSCRPAEYILGPVYVSKEEAFLPLLNALMKNLENDACVEIRSPSSSIQRLHRLIKDSGKLEKETTFITQFTNFLPDYNYDPVYGITDTSVPI